MTAWLFRMTLRLKYAPFSDELTALIVGGNRKTLEIIPKRSVCNNISLPSLSTDISGVPSLVQNSAEKILLCGGYNNKQKCLELKDNQWEEHSNLTSVRIYFSAVSMPEGIFIFGGNPWSSLSGAESLTWEWLPSGTNQWQSGDTTIQSGFLMGCAVKINDTYILLIGGYSSMNRVLKFNTITKSFTNLGDVLKEGRHGHACTRFEDEIIITGGLATFPYYIELSSTEIIHINDLTTTYTTGSLVQARSYPGLVVVHVENKPTVLAVGGSKDFNSLDSIEMWNPTNETWTMTSLKLSEPEWGFGILSLPTKILCP